MTKVSGDIFENSQIYKSSRLLRTKQVSSVELTQIALQKAIHTNEKTNAYITICNDIALKQAERADQMIMQGEGNVLTGIPYCMKDSYVTKEVMTTAASNVLRKYLSPYNSTVYQRLYDCGAVIIGKNNQDAWGHGGSSENTDWGPVRNPWDLKRTAGGSSGGTAAAIATQSAIFGIGEDTGGSIRNPSSFCNTTGLKVTYGRVSRYGTIAYASSLDTVGPMATSVDDCALILNTIAGFDPLDASSSREKVPNYGKNLHSSIKGKKIGVVKEYMNDALDKEVKQVIYSALQKFEELGASIIELSIPTVKYGISIYYLIALSETASNLARYDGIRYGGRRDQFTSETKRRIILGTYALSNCNAKSPYIQALKAREKLKTEFNTAFEKADVLIAPVSPYAPYEFGNLNVNIDYSMAIYLADLYTCATNPVGIPSLALPAGFTMNNLPVGMQIMGPLLSEPILLNIGHQYQLITQWHHHKPSISF